MYLTSTYVLAALCFKILVRVLLTNCGKNHRVAELRSVDELCSSGELRSTKCSSRAALLLLKESASSCWLSSAIHPATGNCAGLAGYQGVEQSPTNALLRCGTALTNGSCTQPLPILWGRFHFNHCTKQAYVQS